MCLHRRCLLLALLWKLESSGSYHSCTVGGCDELPVTQCIASQRPLHEACPLLLKKEVNFITRHNAIQDNGTLGYLSILSFNRPLHIEAHPLHNPAGHLTLKPGGIVVVGGGGNGRH